MSNPEKEEENKAKMAYVLTPKENSPLKIGKEGHMVIDGQSVSSIHSEIVFQQNKFYLRDCSSKFGTLVKFVEDVYIKDEKIRIQYGRVCYSFEFVDSRKVD